tara:strand:- start:406 stop:942 length:537 start_codon:yes stop_codon:yes gene_type:complete
MFGKIEREISSLDGMQEYKFYYGTTDGEIYSYKYKKPRKLRTISSSHPKKYKIVQLSNGKGKKKVFYVHRLIARLFLIDVNNSWSVIHINGNLEDNSVDNLRWKGRKIFKGSEELDTDRIYLGKEISDYIKLVHRAAIHKGIPVSSKIDFFQEIIDNSLEDYINRFGLKKTMYLLENS